MSKVPVRIEMIDLDEQKDSLAGFLQKHNKLTSKVIHDGLQVECASAFELQRTVNKFINSKGLNLTHYTDVNSNVVKIKRFNHKKEEKKNKHPQTAATIRHGW